MKDNIEFWKGIVVDIMDPLQAGRVRVRIFGHHNPNTNQLDNSCLPWAIVVLPPTVGSNSGVGASPNGLTINSLVIGYFDDPYGQQPIVFGVLPRPHFKPNQEISDIFAEEGQKTINGFLDLRENIAEYPVEIEQIEYLPGEEVNIVNKAPEFYPREEYIDKMSPSVINSNIEGIEKTLIEIKRKLIDDGGILEKSVKLAIYPTEKYEVSPNIRFPNIKKANFIQYDESNKYSSDIKSDFSNYRAIKEQNRINSNNEKIYEEI